MAALNFTSGEFHQVLQKAQAFYVTIGKIYCPYFRDSIEFTAAGFEHLRRKAWKRGRNQRDQFMRLKHLAKGPEVLGLSYTVQGVQEGNEWERRHRHGRW